VLTYAGTFVTALASQCASTGAALLLLYCCFTAALLLLYCCFTAALLMIYCCFTDALLLLYCASPGTNLSPAAAGAA
jgi:hypothetical protein